MSRQPEQDILITIEQPLGISEAREPVTMAWLHSIGGDVSQAAEYQYADFTIHESYTSVLWIRCIFANRLLELQLMAGIKEAFGRMASGEGLVLAGKRYATRGDVIEVLKGLGAEYRLPKQPEASNV